MLVWAGIELIFFTVAGMGLCFGFVLKTVLITQGCFLYCSYTEPRPFLLLPPPQQRAGWGGTRSWEGTQLGQLTPTDHRDIPDHMVSCAACKAGGRRRKGGCSEWWRLSSQVAIRRDGALLSWRWLNTCLLMGSGKLIPCLALLACTAFALPIKLSLSQPMNFLTFTLPILSPILTQGEWASRHVGLSCRLGLNHDT